MSTKKKHKKRIEMFMVLGLERGSNLQYILDKLGHITSKYKRYQLGFLGTDPEHHDFGTAWGLQQLHIIRTGGYKKQVQPYRVFKPDWIIDNPKGKYSKKRISRDRRRMIREIVSLYNRALFFVKKGSKRDNRLHKSLKKRGVKCRTVKCRGIHRKKG